MRVIRTFSTPAHWPRVDSRSLQYRDAELSIVYSVHSQKLPTGPPTYKKFNLIFFHAGQICKEGWNYWIDLAFSEFGDALDKCITFDTVHHGDSAVANEGKVGFKIPWDDMGRDAAAVIRDCVRRGEIHRDAPLISFGSSMGGYASLAVAVCDPSLISAHILFDAEWFPGLDINDEVRRKVGRLAQSIKKRAVDKFDSLDAYRDYMNTKFVSATMHPQIKQDVIDSSYIVDRDGKIRMKTSSILQAGAYYSGTEISGLGPHQFPTVEDPVLIVHGEINDFNLPEANEQLAETLPFVEERIVIPKAKHLAPYTHPDECFNAVKGFILRKANDAIAHSERVDKTWGGQLSDRFNAQVENDLALTGMGRGPRRSRL